MTKTTTGSSRLTVILSWVIALVCLVGGALFIWLMPSPGQGAIDLQAKKQKSPKSISDKIKQEQAQRELPANYSEQLVKQSEVLVKKNLEDQLRKFQEMAKKMRQRKNELLTKVEQRKLPRTAPDDANDTSKARNIPQAGKLSANPSVDDMYALLREYEAEIQQNHLAANAAKQALSKGLSFPEVYSSLKQVGKPGGGFGIGNGQPGGGEGSGNGNGFGGMGEAAQGSGNRRPMNAYAGPRLNQEMVKAQALPGRRFSKSADRKGWLYINTWYMIGPWESFGREDFSIVHPPEISVDFDAVYTDGQVGTGVMETDSHPIKVIGEEVYLDGTLRWKFMQSESMHNTVPVTTGHSTYYAYTELYFDEATTMLVAIGTDDSGRVWINGKDVWRDYGTSWYNIDEHIAPFQFRQGWNRILVRLENGGGGACGFSFLIIPQE